MEELYIDIVEEIWGWGFTFEDIVRKTKGFNGSRIILPINSYGGDVMEGLAIHNYVKSLNTPVEARIVAYAMSMGTVIACGADRVVMPENGWYMIHNPWMRAGGDHEDLKHSSEILAKMTVDLAEIYAKKTGLALETILQMMDVETWLTAKEALKMGFVDELSSNVQFVATLDPKFQSKLINIPVALKPETAVSVNQNSQIPMKGLFAKLSAFFGKEINENTSEADLEQMIAAYNQNQSRQNEAIDTLRTELQNLQASMPTEDRINEIVNAAVASALEGQSSGLTEEQLADLQNANAAVQNQATQITNLVNEINALKNSKSGGQQGSGQHVPGIEAQTPEGVAVVKAPEFDALMTK